ncbi:DUF4907 domain-containing protein [Compostibacter hankyongensis]|uniref:DUF4907 domain-containing protein n=1 Tax=Compostibacter hankyongensis TaxID=1007089 RepID=A0ABP8FL60_9BACT
MRCRKIIKVACSILLILGLAAVAMLLYRNNADPLVEAVPVRISDGWGYSIRVNHRLFIYQDRIPGLPGRQPFPDREKAMRVGNMVRDRIRQGKSPTITRADLERHGVSAGH